MLKKINLTKHTSLESNEFYHHQNKSYKDIDKLYAEFLFLWTLSYGTFRV